MHGIYGQIKALSSEASLTSSQQDEENEREPRMCFDPDCSYPFGPACAECRLEFEEKEKRKEARSSPNRWKWEDDESAKAEEQERPESIISHSNASVDTFVPDPRSKKSFRRLVDVYPDTKESFTNLREGIRRDKDDEAAKTALDTPATRKQEGPGSIVSHSNVSVDSKKSFRHLVDVYPETKPKESFTSLREGIRKNVAEPSSVADTSSNATVVGAEVETAIPAPSESEEPDEINDLISDISRMLKRDTDKVPTPVQDWLEEIPDLTPGSSQTKNPPINLKRRSESPEPQASMHERPHRPSPRKAQRTIRQKELCPLCSNPIGDPKDQHLVKCQFAHDEHAREVAAKEAALARGRQWD